jgi:hypothetical protein
MYVGLHDTIAVACGQSVFEPSVLDDVELDPSIQPSTLDDAKAYPSVHPPNDDDAEADPSINGGDDDIDSDEEVDIARI